MKYADGNEAMAGDVVQIDAQYLGTVVACIDSQECLPGYEQWAYLKQGVMVDTKDFGLCHYASETADELTLVSRVTSPN